jgi:hypothetical protein
MTHSVYPAPYTVWSSTGYFLTQQWFKVINEKTVIFSLYHNNSEDTYLLDARINENGQTTILLDYMINLETKIELSDEWYFEETNFVVVYYNDVDYIKAFPEDIDERTNSFARKVQGDFAAVNYYDKDIPNGLITLAEKALFYDDIDRLNISTATFEISIDEYWDKFGHLWYDYENFKGPVCHIYKYKVDNNTYYLTIDDYGGSEGLYDISIKKESDGDLIDTGYWQTLDINARVIKYNNALYFVQSEYNYYSKYTDTICIYKLIPGKIKDYVKINLQPKEFEWEKVFNNHQSYDKSISSYVDSIKNDLMNKSPINDDIQIYMGDENNKYNENKRLRLKSVGGDYDYYEIDFNNDGEPEYYDKKLMFPYNNYETLYLENNFYKFIDNRIMSIYGDFERECGSLIQLWFKEIEGKVFTFRLFLDDGYNYFLNVSLIEDTNKTQVQSYLIVPKREFDISTHE